MAPTLVLFDVDQTLIFGAGCGRRALDRALAGRFGRSEGLKTVVMNGRTDTSILRDALAAIGAEVPLTPSLEQAIWTDYLVFLKKELDASSEARAATGFPQLLDRLRAIPHLYIGLLTGNIRKGAEAKLAHFGLWDYFETGGFGDDDLDRNIVARVAVKRCSGHYRMEFDADEVYVVGDSLRDIACADAISAKCVAVATGLDSYEDLSARKPHALFRDLGDTASVLEVLQGNHTSGTNPLS